MKDQKTTKYAKPVSQRAIAAVLAGLMLMSTVPAQAIAEEIQDAQAVVAAQTATDGTEEVSQPTAIDTTAAADQQTTDTTASDQQNTGGDASGDQQVVGVQSVKQISDEEQNVIASSIGAEAKLEAAASAVAALSPSDEANVTPDDLAIARALGEATADKATDNSANSSNDNRWRNNSNAKTTAQRNMECASGLFKMIGGGISKKPGDVLTALIGLATIKDANDITTNQLMDELCDMEMSISELNQQIGDLTQNIGRMNDRNSYQECAATVRGTDELLVGDDGSVLGVLKLASAKLAEYKELDVDGGKTDRACSLDTPVELIPAEAYDELLNIFDEANKRTGEATSLNSIAAVEQAYYQLICSRSDSVNAERNIVSAYFNYLSRVFNWDVESFNTKQQFLARLSQKYINAYAVENAIIRLKIASNKGFGIDTAALEQQLDSLTARAKKVGEALFGEDGNSGFSAQTRPVGENKVKCYVNGKTYDKGTYARVSAYPKAAFWNAYKTGTDKSLDTMSRNWNVSSGFSANDIREMVYRLNGNNSSGTCVVGMNECGVAPTVGEGDSAHAARNIVEEMEAVGFKNVDTSGDEEGTTLKSMLSSVSNVRGYDGGVRIPYKTLDLSDTSKGRILPDLGKYSVGNRLDASKWVVTNVTRCKDDAGSSHNIFELDRFGAYCARGQLVNIETGEILDNNVLYCLRADYGLTWGGVVISASMSFEYYPFGVLAPGTTDATIQ